VTETLAHSTIILQGPEKMHRYRFSKEYIYMSAEFVKVPFEDCKKKGPVAK